MFAVKEKNIFILLTFYMNFEVLLVFILNAERMKKICDRDNCLSPVPKCLLSYYHNLITSYYKLYSYKLYNQNKKNISDFI